MSKIGTNPFAGCVNLNSIIVDEGNEYYDSREYCNAIVETKTNTLITGCGQTVILESINKIGESAFLKCTGLKKTILPSSVIEIGEAAFHSCSELKEITISGALKKIGFIAFYNCRNLNIIEIPESVTEIGESAFKYCLGLKKIFINDEMLLKDTGIPDKTQIVVKK